MTSLIVRVRQSVDAIAVNIRINKSGIQTLEIPTSSKQTTLLISVNIYSPCKKQRNPKAINPIEEAINIVLCSIIHSHKMGAENRQPPNPIIFLKIQQFPKSIF